ncbi:hypothetical protein EZS27_029193 [termite gut metagenome]|uniref:Uncharacterized protein n=1 Tax=termite gut metagenome TaxID=433724 RepID=A0A5J4QJC7_9ZZZZ
MKAEHLANIMVLQKLKKYEVKIQLNFVYLRG